METSKLENLIVHCSYTPYDRNVTPDDIVMMHCCASYNKNTMLYAFMGKQYTANIITKQYLKLPSGKSVRANLVQGNGWSKPGYSDMICRSGELKNIVPYNFDPYIDGFEITNGARGYNSNSRHIVLAGGWDKNGKKDKIFEPLEIFTEEMLKTLSSYINMQLEIVPNLNVMGHQDVSNKTCPGFDFSKWYENKKY